MAVIIFLNYISWNSSTQALMQNCKYGFLERWWRWYTVLITTRWSFVDIIPMWNSISIYHTLGRENWLKTCIASARLQDLRWYNVMDARQIFVWKVKNIGNRLFVYFPFQKIVASKTYWKTDFEAPLDRDKTGK